MFYTLGLLCLFEGGIAHALVKKIDGVSEEMKGVETVCVAPRQAGSWTKKDNPHSFQMDSSFDVSS